MKDISQILGLLLLCQSKQMFLYPALLLMGLIEVREDYLALYTEMLLLSLSI